MCLFVRLSVCLLKHMHWPIVLIKIKVVALKNRILYLVGGYLRNTDYTFFNIIKKRK